MSETKFQTESLRDRTGHFIEGILVLLSGVAVALFCFDHFLSKESWFEFLGLSWNQLQSWSQTLIWLGFVAVYFGYGFTSHRTWREYARKWWLESVILITWLPLHAILGPNLVALKMLALVGSLAHILRIAIWTAARFNENAFIVIGVGTLTMVVFATTLLMVVEPETYKNFEETAYSVFMTTMTMGPAIQPPSPLGRLIFFFIATGGVIIVALFISVVREYVQRMFGHKDATDQMLQLLRHTCENGQIEAKTEVQALLEVQSKTIDLLNQQVAAQAATIELLREQLELRANAAKN